VVGKLALHIAAEVLELRIGVTEFLLEDGTLLASVNRREDGGGNDQLLPTPATSILRFVMVCSFSVLELVSALIH
jgi:hypothetical protein